MNGIASEDGHRVDLMNCGSMGKCSSDASKRVRIFGSRTTTG